MSGERRKKKGGGKAKAPSKYPKGHHPKSLANLRHWKPGQSGNPGGRRSGRTVTAEIYSLLDSNVRALFDEKQIKRIGGKTGAKVFDKRVAEAIAEIAVRQALKGDFKFFREVCDRTEGKVPIRIAGHGGGPLSEGLPQEIISSIFGDTAALKAAQQLANRMGQLSRKSRSKNASQED